MAVDIADLADMLARRLSTSEIELLASYASELFDDFREGIVEDARDVDSFALGEAYGIAGQGEQPGEVGALVHAGADQILSFVAVCNAAANRRIHLECHEEVPKKKKEKKAKSAP
jgi:hypothetical protein